MKIIGIYSKKTKELLTEIKVSDKTMELLKKQKDPSQTFEDAVKQWLIDEMKESEKTTQSGKYCYQKQGKWFCQNCGSEYDVRKDAIDCCLEIKKAFLSPS